MPSKFVKIVPPFPRQGNGIPSAASRWPDFSERLPFGAYIAATSLLAFVTNPLVLVAGGGAAGYALTRSTNRKIRDNLMCILVSTSYLSASGDSSDDGAGLARRLEELVGEYRNGDSRRRARL